jgi:2-methylcitrate dehydratase PrpD
MKPVLFIVLIGIAGYTWVKKDFGQRSAPTFSPFKMKIIGLLLALVVGFYDGFIGPGTGSFLVLGFIVLLGFDFLHASAHAKLVNLATNLGSILLFITKGKIIWSIAIPMAFANALAIAATCTAGLQQAFRSEAMAKPLHAGRAAEAGVLAAQLAAGGMRSSLDVLEGESGLGHAMSQGAVWSQIGATLGTDFHITRLTFKNHIGCGHTFAAIDGALALQQTHGFGHADIAHVQLGVYQPTLDIAPHVDPQNADQARFSLHYMVASALVHGSVRLSAFEPERLNDPHTRAVMQRIDKSLDPAVDAAFPGRRGARVTITLRDGRQLSLLQPDRKGDPELPLSDADLEAKLMELATPVIGETGARALLERIWQLHQSDQLC